MENSNINVEFDPNKFSDLIHVMPISEASVKDICIDACDSICASTVSCLDVKLSDTISELNQLRNDYNRLANDHDELKKTVESLIDKVISLDYTIDNLKKEHSYISDENDMLKYKILYCKQNGIWAEENC